MVWKRSFIKSVWISLLLPKSDKLFFSVWQYFVYLPKMTKRGKGEKIRGERSIKMRVKRSFVFEKS